MIEQQIELILKPLQKQFQDIDFRSAFLPKKQNFPIKKTIVTFRLEKMDFIPSAVGANSTFYKEQTGTITICLQVHTPYALGGENNEKTVCALIEELLFLSDSAPLHVFCEDIKHDKTMESLSRAVHLTFQCQLAEGAGV